MEPGGGMPGGASRQHFALQQHDIRTAELGQMIKNGTANDAPADDDNLRM
jgi:hypothetical protein